MARKLGYKKITPEIVLENFGWEKLNKTMRGLVEDLIKENLRQSPNFDLSGAFERKSDKNGLEIMSGDRNEGYVFCGSLGSSSLEKRMEKVESRYCRIGAICDAFIDYDKGIFGLYWRRS
jgi:hypothetical protein